MKKYAYICDRKACGDVCPSEFEEYNTCRHTTNKDHSITLQEGKEPKFIDLGDGHFWEVKERRS